MSSLRIVYIALICLAFSPKVNGDKLTVQVEPKSKDCFFYDARASEQIKLVFFVTRGGLLDIDLKITGPSNEPIYSSLLFESGTQSFTATRQGPYEICFSNEMARWTSKIVSFEVFAGEQAADGVLTKDTLDPIQNYLKGVATSLDKVQQDQRYLRIREQKHRDTADSTNSRILYYSIAESVVLLCLSLGQVFYLRRFFDTKRSR